LSFTASCVAKGSIVLSKAIEKEFALEADISQLRHHISVLSKRLHSVTVEKQILADIVDSTMSGEKQALDEEEVAEKEDAPSLAGEELEEATEVVAVKEEVRATESVAGEDMVDVTEIVAGEGSVGAIEDVADEEKENATESVAEKEEDERVPEMAREYNRSAIDMAERTDP